ncbi:hypothetical protein [Paenibacillus sp. 1001270B_150601_E10]|uniref:hypothetical protein n=1 Tax=Paenibacillus sp. 1001270B_150601_E10 TaxID=2787079 RepID=UPI0018A0D55F|nr:hypothetical protein [Paenibacillus sp. 1001270B_150601_E10]
MTKRAAPLETEEDLHLIKECVLLPILLDALERDLAILGKTPLKMNALYCMLLRHAQDQITMDLARIRKQMRVLGLKIYEERRTELGVEAYYLCRGYHHKCSMLWSLVRAELHTRLSAYFNMEWRGKL